MNAPQAREDAQTWKLHTQQALSDLRASRESNEDAWRVVKQVTKASYQEAIPE
jgi:hypothetical protein